MAVADAIRESMSAVMDGEGTEMDLARVLKAVEDDADARAHWQRLQRSRSVLVSGSAGLNIDVSAGVREALSTASAPRARRVGPLGSLAVAASVTFAVVFGGQMLVGHDAPIPSAQVPGGVVAMGGAPIQASYGSSYSNASNGYNSTPTVQPKARQVNIANTPTVSRVYEQLARERFHRYAQEHAHSTAALQPNALVPFARVPNVER